MQNKRSFVLSKLAEHSLTQVWLRNELEKRGVNTIKTELSGALKGNRKGNKAVKIVETSVAILTEYEERYANGNS